VFVAEGLWVLELVQGLRLELTKDWAQPEPSVRLPVLEPVRHYFVVLLVSYCCLDP
jgi:hypothetical protein